jgi:Uma2 family endonuclease
LLTMTLAVEAEHLTTEQLLALPDPERWERWLIAGQLRERPRNYRNHAHGRVEATICWLLHNWADTPAMPKGEVLVGEAGIRLRRNPDTTVGVDVAYLSPETADANLEDEGFVEGAPVLVVEILSPSDKHEDVTEKVAAYLEAGVKLIWVVDPAFRTVTVYRSDAEPQLFNITQDLSAEPHLPGFHPPVCDIFSR